MDTKVVYPYLMLLLDMINRGEIKQTYANDLIGILENYLFRIKICQLPINRMNKIVIALCDTKKDNGNLKFRLLKLLKGSFPSDEQLSKILMTSNIYSQRHHLAKLVLEIMEENLTKETINFDDAQVEHIMPQRLNEHWRYQVTNADMINNQYGGTIGNLTLTKYNQEMSNKLYTEKRNFYRNSNIILTRNIAKDYDHWDRETIINRTKYLTNLFLSIFPMPNFSEITTKAINGEYNINDSVDVAGKKTIYIKIDDNTYSVDSWRQMLVDFLNDIWNKDSHNLEIITNDSQLNKLLFNVKYSPIKLENGMEVETYFSAREILNIIVKIANLCDITDQVTYAFN